MNKLTTKQNLNLALESEKLLSDSREMLCKYKLTTSDAASSLGKLDCRAALHIMGRGKDVEGKEFQSMDEIAKDSAQTCICTLHAPHIVHVHACCT